MLKYPLLILISLLMLACQSSAPVKQEQQAAQADTEVVVMPALGGKPSPQNKLGLKPMTFEELNSCGGKVEKISKEKLVLKADDEKLRKRKAELNSENQTLASARTSINSKNAKLVEEFNKKLQQQMLAVKQHNDDITVFNQKTTELNLLNNDFNVSCANRPYQKSDYEKLPTGYQSALKSYSQTIDIPLADETPDANQTVSPGVLHLPGSGSRK